MASRAALNRYCENSATAYLPERIQAFHSQYPLITFRIVDGHPHEVVKFLEED